LIGDVSRLRKSALFVLLGAGLFQLARLGLLLRYREFFAELPAGRILAAWASGLRFDLSILLAFLALPLVAINLPLRVALRPGWQRAWSWVAFAPLVVLALMLGGDVAYFEHVQRHMAAELLTMENDWRFLVTMALGPTLPFLVAVAALLGGLALLWRRILRGPVEERLRPGRFALVVVLLVAGIRGSLGAKPLNAIDAFAAGSATEAQLSLNGAFTGVRSMMRRGHVRARFFPDDEARRIVGVSDARYPVERTVQPRGARHNVVFVLMESWSAYYVDAFGGHGFGATPRFDALAAGGAKFTRFYAAGQRSYEGLQATLTGLPSLPGMPTLTSGLATRVSRLGAMAHDAGFRTLFLQASNRRSLRLDAIAAATGFAEYYGQEDMPIRLQYPDPAGAAFGWDYEMYRLLLDKLHGEQRPFFAYLFTGTTHTPYPRLPARFMTHPHDDGEAGFLNALSYADWSVGELIDAARSEPWFANTIFVFTADHTRGGTVAHSLDQSFHVPFVVYAPGLVEPGVHDVVGSHLDVLPTLAELMGIGGTYSAIGADLFEKEAATALAPVTGGELVGLIGAKGFVSHTLRRRVDGRADADAPPGWLDALERRLLATCQLVYTLHEKNCWASPGARPAPGAAKGPAAATAGPPG
jgi:phosphoglycerol transferase MdoB-like AlkP superfamily enzyme